MGWVIAALAIAAGAAADTPEPGAFFNEFAERRDAIDSLTADFVQTTVTPDEEIVSTGTLTYTRPKRLIFRYDDPPLHYMIDGLRVFEYDAELEQIQIYQLEDRPESEAFYLGFESDGDRLREAYDVRAIPPTDPGRHAVAVEFLPKPHPEGEQPYFQKVRLQLSKGEFLPSEILIVNDEESHTTFQISNFRVNEPLTPEQTHIVVPAGTTVVDNDEFVGTTDAEFTPFPAMDPDRAEETADPVGVEDLP